MDFFFLCLTSSLEAGSLDYFWLTFRKLLRLVEGFDNYLDLVLVVFFFFKGSSGTGSRDVIDLGLNNLETL
jgi:hypothetical protein